MINTDTSGYMVPVEHPMMGLRPALSLSLSLFQGYIAAFLLCASEENNAMTFTEPLSVTLLPLGENMQSDTK